MDDITDTIECCSGRTGIDRSTVLVAINTTSRACRDDGAFARSARVMTRTSVSAIETVCEQVREAAHGVLIGAIPDLGQAA
jgi:hypothetical protein